MRVSLANLFLWRFFGETRTPPLHRFSFGFRPSDFTAAKHGSMTPKNRFPWRKRCSFVFNWIRMKQGNLFKHIPGGSILAALSLAAMIARGAGTDAWTKSVGN